ncbi:hypothetical protein S83_059528, partial [Arachis hypogaea]
FSCHIQPSRVEGEKPYGRLTVFLMSTKKGKGQATGSGKRKRTQQTIQIADEPLFERQI